ncbi:NAD(P)-dependent oxidoreductase [Agrobacterium tumefaciens]|uniref:NAD(P)-dependent oxidoreductase n=1 Tax=Agrobacterium tumefaciens TaxID=358 RepID=UPI001574E52C|nr:NAD(P)-dependent oxidoreductase [Agrobacterium tumefaciens]NSY99654.1 NAD(P)-dependent oxidoreductase [Agrobacterium tumefaciens]NSZ36407.1 NAD(P)-dependent oxidoreductase [Agrobacterium tumefaciens]NTB21923.1 NAD(P)-dependent oxidoreductase [Agrobacterium tumefaciens]NTB31731.1 NAD(P)-dependent oxidoreductase [Agrobacterium tumefaciens]NTB32212.1 NAD(P)-dependent oxidoreductase [Agrobacterium tumefaciens]
MAKVALIGASGNAGSRILKELSDRGHAVTAIARNPDKIAALPGVTAIKGDAQDGAALAELVRGHDAVVSSTRFTGTNFTIITDALRKAGVTRYLVVGGAASLEVAPGKRLLDQPGFPEAYKEEATNGAATLDYLRSLDDIDWTFLSPSAMFVPGERTGSFRLAKDELLSREDGSSISFEDYAIAMSDEIEEPKHIRQRFTAGY